MGPTLCKDQAPSVDMPVLSNFFPSRERCVQWFSGREGTVSHTKCLSTQRRTDQRHLRVHGDCPEMRPKE